MSRRSSALGGLLAWVWLVVSVGALLSTGCGSKKGTITGTVNYRGQPLPSGVIKFINAETNEIVGTASISDGNYSVSGIPSGLVKIAIHMAPSPTGTTLSLEKVTNLGTISFGADEDDAPPKDKGPRVAINQKKGPASKRVTVPAKYCNPETSGLTYTVQPGIQQAPPLDLQ